MGLLTPWSWIALVGMSVPLAGTVEDAGGRPVARASVWLSDSYAREPGPGEILAEATTDAEGRFRLDRPDGLVGRGASWSPTLWAHKPGARLAFVEFKHQVPGPDEPVKLALGPPAGATLRVLQPDGKAAAGARVLLARASFRAPRVPAALVRRIAATADADGRATLPDIRPEDVDQVDVTAEGLVTQCLAIEPAGPGEMTASIRPVGAIRVRIVSDNPDALRGWRTRAWTTPDDPGFRGPSTSWSSEDTDDLGLAQHRAIAVGRIALTVTPPAGSRYLAASPIHDRNRAGETTEIRIPIRLAVRVSGVVREAGGGAPIPGVKVSLHPLRAGGSFVDPVTNAEGRYSVVILPGEARFSLREVPPTHFRPPVFPHWRDFEIKPGDDPLTLEPVELRRAETVRGRVVDEAGRPVAAASVNGHWSSPEFERNPDSVRATTDARGEFTLGSIAPGAEVRVSGALGWLGETEVETVPAGGGPVTLRLVRRPRIALTGRAIEPDGKPVADAEVRVRLRTSSQGFDQGGEVTFEDGREVRTAADGTFRTPPEVPSGHQYRVSIKASGREPAESGWIVAPASTFPDLALRRSERPRTVAGRVVDTAGRPIADAEVFQSGDGPRRTRDTTDAEGRFRVPGVPDDSPAFLFARKAGHRFLGRRVGPSDQAVELVVPRLDEPPAARLKATPSPSSRAEEREIARDLLAPALRRALDGSAADFERREVFEIEALVDPDRVSTMIENQTLAADASLLASLVLARHEDGPRSLIEALDALGPAEKTRGVASTLFGRLAGAPVALRREILGRASGVDQDAPFGDEWRASSLRQIAERWLDLGDVARAAPIVREIQAIVARLPADAAARLKGELADVLAPIDLPAALGLLEGDKPDHALDQRLARMAARVAATDPAAARGLIDRIKDDSNKIQARRAASVRIAAVDLPAARALAEGYPDPVLPAVLPAIAAGKLAGTDPEKARALLLESINRLGRIAEAGVPRQMAQPAVAMARLLPLAARIDPDRAPGYLWFALASRPARPAEPEARPIMPWHRQAYADLAELAMLIAPYDRPAADAVFAIVAGRVPGIFDDTWGPGDEGTAIVRWAAAYDARAARSMFDVLPEDPVPPKGRAQQPEPRFQHEAKAKARLAIARTLGLPPELRRRHDGAQWSPGAWLAELDETP